MIFDFLDNFIVFPDDFLFMKYLVGSVIIILFTYITISFFISIFLAIFRK